MGPCSPRGEGFGVGADGPGVRGGLGGEAGGEAVGGDEDFGFLMDGAGDEVVEGHLVQALRGLRSGVGLGC